MYTFIRAEADDYIIAVIVFIVFYSVLLVAVLLVACTHKGCVIQLEK